MQNAIGICLVSKLHQVCAKPYLRPRYDADDFSTLTLSHLNKYGG